MGARSEDHGFAGSRIESLVQTEQMPLGKLTERLSRRKPRHIEGKSVRQKLQPDTLIFAFNTIKCYRKLTLCTRKVAQCLHIGPMTRRKEEQDRVINPAFGRAML